MKLLLIDANSLIHRAFHALPPLTSRDGKPAGALYGLANTLLKILRDEKPDYAAAAFDTPEVTFRKEMFEKYKAHRPKAPDELTYQIIRAHEIFGALGIPTLEKPGFEADDILGTLAERFGGEKNLKMIILTGDLDTLQLVNNEKIVVLAPKQGVTEMTRYNEDKVVERFGLRPDQLPDYKGLVGDPSDNIPGVPGVGPKTASSLLQEHGDLKNLYKALKKNPGSKSVIKKILDNEGQAFLSKKLGTINTGVPLKVNLSDLKYEDGISEELITLFQELSFDSLIKRLGANNADNKKRPTSDGRRASSIDAVFIEDINAYLKKPPKFLSSDQIKVARDWKPFMKELLKHGVEVKNTIFDLKIALWLIDPDQDKKDLDAALKKPMEEIFIFASKKIKELGLTKVFYQIEMPLIRVLAEMEGWGIKIDPKMLKELKKKVDKELKGLTRDIYKEASIEFNINSPKQVGELLFDKLRVGAISKKTPTGQHKTSEKVLADLKDKHPIVPLLLNYRELFKIKSTYIEPLLKASQESGRIHTTFLQTATATGRLASESPNLQNIPKGGRLAGDLRNAFVAEKGSRLLAFDYSQLELRLLAHISGDDKLQKAFREGKDIHKLTASQVLNVPLERVTTKQRELAKILNFGVVYGMGPRAFSEASGITLEESKKFINEYFNDFPGVKRWQEETVKKARARGYVENLNGRRRFWNGEPQMERAMINMPIQSLGADIIKIGMIKTMDELKERGWLGSKAKLILSIHDELLLEATNDILTSITPVVKNILEKKVLTLSVPLTVDVKSGERWGEMNKI